MWACVWVRILYRISYHSFTKVEAGQGSASELTPGAVPQPRLRQVTSFCLNIFLFPLITDPPVHPNFTMSQPPSTSTSTSSFNFQSIFNTALKAYEKKTQKDLLAHPLAVQLQACHSPSDILAILRDKVKELDRSRSANERLSQWLNPTMHSPQPSGQVLDS